MKGNFGKVKMIMLIGICIIALVFSCFANKYVSETKYTKEQDIEAYQEVGDNENGTQSPYVKFEAYFAGENNKKYLGVRQDLNKEVVLVTNISVQTQGVLKNAKIILYTTEGNFTMVRNIPTDDLVSSVGADAVFFRDIKDGTTKTVKFTLAQSVVNGGQFNFNINKLSHVNKLVFSGLYQDTDGSTKEIEKEIDFRIDWYGQIEFQSRYSGFYTDYDKNKVIVDKENQKVYISYNLQAYSKNMGDSTSVQAPDKAVIMEVDIPKLNGVNPEKVNVYDISEEKKELNFDYKTDESADTRKLTITMTNPISSSGTGNIIIPGKAYKANILVEYPFSAWQEQPSTTYLRTQAKAHLEGYSTNEDGDPDTTLSDYQEETLEVNLKNPQGNILIFRADIESNENILAKANMRLNYEKDEKAKQTETDPSFIENKYLVNWEVDLNISGAVKKVVFSEDYRNSLSNIPENIYAYDTDHFRDNSGKYYDMENFVSYSGISVTANSFDVLGEEGYLKVYEVLDGDNTRLLQTIKASDANKIIKYEREVKHIKIESSVPEKVGTIKIQHYKTIDPAKMIAECSKEDFEKLTYVYSALKGSAIIENSTEGSSDELKMINGDVSEIPYTEGSVLYSSSFDATGQRYTFHPQKLNTNTLYMQFRNESIEANKGFIAWENPTIFIEFPSTFKNVIFNELRTEPSGLIKVTDSRVDLEGDKLVLKLKTEGIIDKRNEVYIKFQSEVEKYEFSSLQDKLRVFAYNKLGNNYKYYFSTSKDVQDIYDIDGDGYRTETVRAEETTLYYSTADQLVTTTQVKKFDEKGTIVEGPNVATIEKDQSKKQRTARINVKTANGYEERITNVSIVGRIPFKGNKHVINDTPLSSDFSTTMQSTGIISEEDIGYKVSYSTDANAQKDDDSWQSSPSNWADVKSYKIEISEIAPFTSCNFYYDITLPSEDDYSYGEATYATHAIYFTHETSNLSTEPDRVGIQIGSGQTFRLNLKNYKYKTSSYITRATDSLRNASSTIQIKGENYGKDYDSRNDKTLSSNTGTYSTLYVGAIYTIKQKDISIPYLLNDEEIQFRVVPANSGYNFEILNLDDTQRERIIKAIRINTTEYFDTVTINVDLDIQNMYKYNLIVENKVKDELKYIRDSKFGLLGQEQITEESIQTATDGTTTWNNLLTDTLKIRQTEVGEEPFDLNNKTYRLKVSRNDEGKIQAGTLQYSDGSDSWVDDGDSSRKVRVEDTSFDEQPKVYVLIENDYKDAIISATKTCETKRPGYVLEDEEIKYKIKITNDGYKDKTVTVKDQIPAGTTFVANSGTIAGKPSDLITEDSLREGFPVTVNKQSEVEVTFKVTANKLAGETTETDITNTANVDGEDTDEVTIKEYKTQMDNSITKTGDETIVNSQDRVNYKIKYTTEVEHFDGKAEITIVDKLELPIDKGASDLDGGEYDPVASTITWKETVNVDTYLGTNGKMTIEKEKNIQLKYIYDNVNEMEKVVHNDVTGKTVLLKQKPNSEVDDDYIIEKEGETKTDDHDVNVKIPAQVVVHHYLYDKNLGGNTQKQLTDDETKTGIVGDSYTVGPSDKVNKNYRCREETPKSGKLTEEPQEVIYYYELKDATAETDVTKTVSINGNSETPTLTTENGKVNYTIKQNISINEYQGKAKIVITDKLPAPINQSASKLEKGVYDEKTTTITWTEEKDIDTFTSGPYSETITKNIELVYEGQNVIGSLINNVNAKLTLYYPDVHPDNPNGERIVKEDNDDAEIQQKYMVSKTVEKIWDDRNNAKGHRPTSITVQLTANGAVQGNPVVLNDANQWKTTFSDLPKYTDAGSLINYSVRESATAPGDLDHYEPQANIVTSDTAIKVTNKYHLANVQLDSNIQKTGTEKITNLSQSITYKIHYESNLTDYQGDAQLVIVDHLPFAIDTSASNYKDGKYDKDANTITWSLDLTNLNIAAGQTQKIEFDREITVKYIGLTIADKNIQNSVEGSLRLWETLTENKVQDQMTTLVQIPGKVIVHYKDKTTGEEITYEENGEKKQYQYEINGNAGDRYVTDQKVIPGYNFDSVDGNRTGTLPDGTEEVTYYYTKKDSGGLNVRWVDENGNDLATPDHLTGKVGDPYNTEAQDFDGYELERVEGDQSGTLPEIPGEVVYRYRRKRGKVIVQHLEKNTNKELMPQTVTEYPIGDTYTTERANIPNYKVADPQPSNKTGTVTKEDTYVTYYYEKKSSGKIVVKHVDVDTNQEILNGSEPYRSEKSGFVGDHYSTSPEDIPYYNVVEELLPSNRDGIFEEQDKEIVYYYRRKPFNFKVDKEIVKATVNGKEQRLFDNKLAKIEVVVAKMNSTHVVITYNIKVSNTGEIAGTTTVVEKLPKHFTINNSAYQEWTENDEGNLETQVTLGPGETKDFRIELVWKNGNENFGDEVNSVELKDVKNDVNYPETNTDDNTSEAEVIMGVKTGLSNFKFIIIYIIILIIIAIEVILYVRRKREDD